MKREIKFRALNDVMTRWVYGSLMNGYNWADFIIEDAGFEHRVRVDSESIGQFTGLKDKNGVDIYEGDIVDFHTIRLGRGKATVFFNDGCFFLNVEGQDSHFPFPNIPERKDIEVEVIGNIHEAKL